MTQRSWCFWLRVRSSYVAKSIYNLFVRKIRSLGVLTKPEFVASSSCNWFAQSSYCLDLEAAAVFVTEPFRSIPSSLVPALVSPSTTKRAPPVLIAPQLKLPQLEPSPSVASTFCPPVVALVVLPPHYIAAPRYKSLDLPIKIVVCDTSRTILNIFVECRVVPLFTLNKSISSLFLFEVGTPLCQSFDEVIGQLARNLHRYCVVLFDRSRLFETLRF